MCVCVSFEDWCVVLLQSEDGGRVLTLGDYESNYCR